MEWNHDRPLSSFQESIDLLIVNGYKPIAVSQLMFEDVFVFETDEEATKAYNQFERNSDGKLIGIIVGWWYSKNDFLEEVKDYETTTNLKVFTHWLK